MLGMIKIGDAARRLGITTMELRDSAHRGEVKFVRTPGGVHYFREQDLEEYAKKQSQAKHSENGMKISEVARLFDVSVTTIASWAERGYLRYTKTEGRSRLFPVDDVEALLKKMQGMLDENEEDI